MMQPDYEDFKRRIALSETDEGVMGELLRIEEITDRTADANGIVHPNLEELCGYADGMLRRKRPERWARVRRHIETCLECLGEVKHLRSVVPLSRRFSDGTMNAIRRVRETFWPDPDRISPRDVRWIQLAVVSIVLAIAVSLTGGTIAAHKIGSADTKADIYKEQVEKLTRELETLRQKYADLNQMNADLKAELRKQFANSQISQPGRTGSSTSYTPPESPSSSSTVPYTPST
jgi:hypothetical protein